MSVTGHPGLLFSGSAARMWNEQAQRHEDAIGVHPNRCGCESRATVGVDDACARCSRGTVRRAGTSVTRPAPRTQTPAVTRLVPSFFGDRDRQLFGIYHVPDGDAVQDAGVVLCYPGPQEYSQLHWAYQKLAGMLASAGLHALRFDYFATGDSAGRAEEGTLGQWALDIEAAVQELRDVAGIRRVSLIGMRLGAVLANRAVANGLRIRDLVLWDPVVDGRSYVAELDAVEVTRLNRLQYPEPDEPVPGELMGLSFLPAMRERTAAVNFLSEPLGAVDRVLVVNSEVDAGQQALHERFTAQGIQSTLRIVEDPKLYRGQDHPSDSLLSHNIPAAITAYVARSRE